jgi:hypothetical protein
MDCDNVLLYYFSFMYNTADVQELRIRLVDLNIE